MKRRDLISQAISVDRFLRDYCGFITPLELKDLETFGITPFTDYRVISIDELEKFKRLDIFSLRDELRHLGIKIKSLSKEEIDYADVVLGNVLVVTDHYGKSLYFDWTYYNFLCNTESLSERNRVSERTTLASDFFEKPASNKVLKKKTGGMKI